MTIRALLQANAIPEGTYCTRLMRGWDKLRAATTPVDSRFGHEGQSHTVLRNGVIDTVYSHCKREGLRYGTVRSRLDRGLSVNAAFAPAGRTLEESRDLAAIEVRRDAVRQRNAFLMMPPGGQS